MIACIAAGYETLFSGLHDRLSVASDHLSPVQGHTASLWSPLIAFRLTHFYQWSYVDLRFRSPLTHLASSSTLPCMMFLSIYWVGLVGLGVLGWTWLFLLGFHRSCFYLSVFPV